MHPHLYQLYQSIRLLGKGISPPPKNSLEFQVQDTLHFRYPDSCGDQSRFFLSFGVYVPARERDILRLHQESVETVR